MGIHALKEYAEQIATVRAEPVEAPDLTGLRFDRLNANGLKKCFQSSFSALAR
jgi:hypothetical protein